MITKHRPSTLGGSITAGTGPSDPITDNSAAIARQVFGATASVLALTTADGTGDVLVTASGPSDIDRAAFGAKLVARLRQSNTVLTISDARMNAAASPLSLVRHSACLAFLAAPIHDSAGRVIGALCVAHRHPHSWSGDDATLIEGLAAQTSRAFAQKQAIDRLQADVSHHHDLLEKVTQHACHSDAICQAMAARDLSPDDKIRAVLKAGCEALYTDYAVLTKVAGATAHTVATSGETARRLPVFVDGRYTAQILAEDRCICFNDTTQSRDPLRRDVFGRPPTAFFGTPILLDGRVFGTVEFSSITSCVRSTASDPVATLSLLHTAIASFLLISRNAGSKGPGRRWRRRKLNTQARKSA